MVLTGVTIKKKVKENEKQAERQLSIDSKSVKWYIVEQDVCRELCEEGEGDSKVMIRRADWGEQVFGQRVCMWYEGYDGW